MDRGGTGVSLEWRAEQMDTSGFQKFLARIGAETVLGALLAAVVPSAGSLATVLAVARHWTAIGEIRWPLGVAVAALIGLAVYGAVTRRPAIYRVDYPRVRFRYEVLSRTINYRIGADGLLHYAKTIRVRALQDQLEEFVDRYAWSGHDLDYPRAGRNAVRIDPMNDRAGMWKYFRVYFGRSLQKGEEHEFEVEWPPISDWMCAQPFASMSTDEPTHRMRFHIQIPPAAVVGNRAVIEKLRAVESVTPFRSEEVTFDENGSLTYDIPAPSLYHHFRVRWFWSDEIKAVSQRRGSIPAQAAPVSEERRLGT
jgi:hypothetical protein